MPDYGHGIEFGLFPRPLARGGRGLIELARSAEVLGLQHLGVQDHPYNASFFDTWTLLAAIGASTSRIRVWPDVASLPLRAPVILAKSAATLDLLTGGRVSVGLGTGAMWEGIASAGGPVRTPKESVDALVEAIGIMRGMWAGGELTAMGEHYAVRDLAAGPVPAHDIPIYLGAYGPRMLKLTGQLADGWVPSVGYTGPTDFTTMNAVIDRGAMAAGRSPADIRRLYNIFGRFGTDRGFLQGTPREWSEQLAALALEEGVSVFLLGTNDPEHLQRFADEVRPQVLELVAAGRRSAPANPPPTPNFNQQ